MDFDIEMDDVVMDTRPVPEAYTSDIVVGEEQEPGEIDEELPSQADGSQSDDRILVPNKVHMRGVDTFTPNDVKAYLQEHFGSTTFEKLEWIDDTSLNFVFASESTAQDALIALASVPIVDATQLPPLETIPAKSYSAKPDSMLSVRFAVTGDKKLPRASERSRFYLLNPDYDPEVRRRRGDFRDKYRERDGHGRRNGRDRRNSPRGDNRIDDYETETFDVNLYDDDETSLAKRITTKSAPRRGSSARLRDSPESDDGRRRASRQNREKELFPDKRAPARKGYSSRDRSASPVRDEGRMELDDLARDREAIGRNREKARALKDRLSARDKTPKELFPSKTGKDLFPTKVSSGADGKAQMDQIEAPVVLTSDRITPRSTDSNGGFSIRGMATQQAPGQGIAIKGTAAQVRELFPDKAGNAGKELFAELLPGRRRQRAEDTW